MLVCKILYICHFQKVHARQTSTSLARCQSSIKQHNLPGNVAPHHHFAEFLTADLNSSILFTESLCADIFSQISLPSTLCCFEPLFCFTQMCTQFFGFFFHVTPTIPNSLSRAGITHWVGLGNYSQDYISFLCSGSCLGINTSQEVTATFTAWVLIPLH